MMTNSSLNKPLLPEAMGRSWQGFWHAEGSTLSLGLFRILFAYCLFREVSTTRAKSLFTIEGGFHLPYSYVPSIIQPVSEQAFHLMQTLQYPLIALLALGLLMRPAIIGLLALQGYIFFSDALNFRNHPYFFLLVLVLLLFSPADESVSFKSIRRIYRHRQFSINAVIGPSRPMTFQRLIMVEVCIVYFIAGIHKINLFFLDGSELAKLLNKTIHDWGGWQVISPAGETIIRLQDVVMIPEVLIAASVVILVLEVVLPFSLWFRRTRVLSFIVGIGFHVAIAFFMNIFTFSLAMIGSYLLFMDPTTLPTLATKLFQRKKADNTGAARTQ